MTRAELLLPAGVKIRPMREKVGTVNGSIAQLCEAEGRRLLHLRYPDGSSEYFLVPQLFKSFEELSSRKLGIFWEEGASAIEIYSSMLVGLDSYIRTKYPGFWIVTPIKVYADKRHGEPQEVQYGFVPVVGFLQEIEKRRIAVTEKKNGGQWTGGYSGVLYVSPEPGYTFLTNKTPAEPYKEFSPKMTILMADLEVAASGNPQKDMTKASRKLAEAGFSGWVLESGRSYHFLSDVLMPHDPFVWQALGKLLEILTPKGEAKLQRYARKFISAEGLKEAQVIARRGLVEIPSGSKTNSDMDFRWAFHQIERGGISILRSLLAKGYSQPPKLVAQIR